MSDEKVNWMTNKELNELCGEIPQEEDTDDLYDQRKDDQL